MAIAHADVSLEESIICIEFPENEVDLERSHDDHKSCCSANMEENNCDEQDNNCCGDDCSCSCCDSLLASSLQLPTRPLNAKEFFIINIEKENTFSYKSTLGRNYTHSLLDPPRV